MCIYVFMPFFNNDRNSEATNDIYMYTHLKNLCLYLQLLFPKFLSKYNRNFNSQLQKFETALFFLLFCFIFFCLKNPNTQQNQYLLLNWGFPSLRFESIYTYKKLTQMSMDCKNNIQEATISIM